MTRYDTVDDATKRLTDALRAVAEAGRDVATNATHNGCQRGGDGRVYYRVDDEDLVVLREAVDEWSAASEALLVAVAEHRCITAADSPVTINPGETITCDPAKGSIEVRLADTLSNAEDDDGEDD